MVSYVQSIFSVMSCSCLDSADSNGKYLLTSVIIQTLQGNTDRLSKGVTKANLLLEYTVSPMNWDTGMAELFHFQALSLPFLLSSGYTKFFSNMYNTNTVLSHFAWMDQLYFSYSTY